MSLIAVASIKSADKCKQLSKKHLIGISLKNAP
jgi:hypothetical protein